MNSSRQSPWLAAELRALGHRLAICLQHLSGPLAADLCLVHFIIGEWRSRKRFERGHQHIPDGVDLFRRAGGRREKTALGRVRFPSWQTH